MATWPVHIEIIEQRPDRTGATAEGWLRPRYHGNYPGMLKSVLSRIWDGIGKALRRTGGWIRRRTRPLRSNVLLTVADLFRSRRELIAENALLRTQLVGLDRHVARPKFKPRDRALMVLLSRLARSWRDAVLIVKPQSVPRWHRYGFRLWWRFKSRAKARPPRISRESVALIQEMARDNGLYRRVA